MRRLVLLSVLAVVFAGSLAAGAPAAATPSGTIAFVRGGDIWVMGADGTQQRRLTTSPRQESRPTWSPNGRTIAYIRSGARDGFNFCVNQIWLMDADGRHKRRVPFSLGPRIMPGTTHRQTTYSVGELAWAPSGRDIAVGASAYSFYPDMAGGLFKIQLYLVRPNGTHQRRLGPIQYGMGIDGLTWRPDGSQVLLVPWVRGYGHLLVYDRAAGRYSEPYGDREMWNAVWSPDGSRIAAVVLDDEYTSTMAGGSGRGGMPPYPRHLAVIDQRTQEETALWVWGQSPSTEMHPSWAPDGGWLACSYGSEDESTFDILLQSADGAEVTVLATDAVDPSWQPQP